MTRILWFLHLVISTWTYPLQNPFQYFYPSAYPSSGPNLDLYRYNPLFQPYVSTYPSGFIRDYNGYSTLPDVQRTLNVMAEVPYAVSKEFSIVPMFVVSKTNMNMITKGNITSVSKDQPELTLKLNQNSSIQCTPAVQMTLEKPVVVSGFKSDVLFPSEVKILHQGVEIPIKIGAVIAPVLPQTYVSQETPISVKVVYAVPTKPLKITITIEQEERSADSNDTIDENVNNNNKYGALNNTKTDYVNNADAVSIPAQEAVVVESEAEQPPKVVTLVDFPKQEAEPHLDVDEEDEELVNRNPPIFVAPAGIVGSTQPIFHEEQFKNDKESPYLEMWRDPTKKKKV